MNSVTLIGRAAVDPSLRFVPGSGMAVANVTMAIDKGLTREKKAEFEAQGKPTADFVRIVVWGKQAENMSVYVQKGKLFAVNGSIQTSSYKANDGSTKYQTEVLANRVEYLEKGESQQKKESQSFKEDDYSFQGSMDFETIEDDDDVPF
jgi:single-strand DNA-binding protein